MRYALWRPLAAVFLSLGIGMTADAAHSGEVIGWMDIAPSEGQIQITGRAYSPLRTDIDFVLQIERSGRSGKTTTKQGGKATVEAGGTVALSTTSVNMETQDQLAVLLTISRGGDVLSTSGIHVGPQSR